MRNFERRLDVAILGLFRASVDVVVMKAGVKLLFLSKLRKVLASLGGRRLTAKLRAQLVLRDLVSSVEVNGGCF